MLLKNPHKDKAFSDEDLSRIIEMGWEDRTPFEAIESQFGINQDGVIKVMRANLKLNSFYKITVLPQPFERLSLPPPICILNCHDQNELNY